MLFSSGELYIAASFACAPVRLQSLLLDHHLRTGGTGDDHQTDQGGRRTALFLAVRACVDSYWTARRSPDSVGALLRAGATPSGIEIPSGYKEVDDLLRLSAS